MRSLAPGHTISDDTLELDIVSVIKDDLKRGYILYEASYLAELAQHFPEHCGKFLLQELAPGYVDARDDNSMWIVEADKREAYDKTLARYFKQYIDYANGKQWIEYGIPRRYIRKEGIAYIVYGYDDWIVNQYILKIKNTQLQQVLLNQANFKFSIKPELQYQVVFSNDAHKFNPIDRDTLSNILTTGDKLEDILEDVMEAELDNRLKEFKETFAEYALKLDELDRSTAPVEPPADKKPISLGEVNQTLRRSNIWQALKHIVDDRDTFYRVNHGGSGGIEMYHNGHFFHDWITWLS